MIEKYLSIGMNLAFSDEISDVRKNRVIQVVILRELTSHSTFTTEGRGVNTAIVEAGIENKQKITRVVMFKRKQVAQERRTGKAIRRNLIEQNSLKVLEGTEECSLIENLCSKCPDCMLYGFAAQGGENSRKSRIITDSAFSVRPYESIVEEITLNAVDEVTHTTKSALSSKEYIIPGVVFPCVETFVDITEEEFYYLLVNILLTKRYGGEVSRLGTIENHIAGIYFSNGEIFTNLQLTKLYYDIFCKNNLIDEININHFIEKYDEVEKTILDNNAVSIFDVLKGDKLEQFLKDFKLSTKNDVLPIFQAVEEKLKNYINKKDTSKKKK